MQMLKAALFVIAKRRNKTKQKTQTALEIIQMILKQQMAKQTALHLYNEIPPSNKKE